MALSPRGIGARPCPHTAPEEKRRLCRPSSAHEHRNGSVFKTRRPFPDCRQRHERLTSSSFCPKINHEAWGRASFSGSLERIFGPFLFSPSCRQRLCLQRSRARPRGTRDAFQRHGAKNGRKPLFCARSQRSAPSPAPLAARRVRPKAAASSCGARQAPVCWSWWKRRQQRHARCVFRAHHVYRSKDGRRNHPAFPRKRLFILRSRLLFMGFTGLGGHVRKRRARPRFEVHTARSIRRPWISERGSCSSKKNSSIDTFILRVYFFIRFDSRKLTLRKRAVFGGIVRWDIAPPRI